VSPSPEGLTFAFTTELTLAVEDGIDFVASSDVRVALETAGLDQVTNDLVVGSYEDSQLRALKAGLLGAAGLAVLGLFTTAHLPSTVARPDEDVAESDVARSS